MSSEKPQTVHRRDYRPADYTIDRVDLDFDLGEEATIVAARLEVRRRAGSFGEAPPLILAGEALETLEVKLDGELLGEPRCHVADSELSIERPPERFVLETRVRIRPQDNTSLSGLYRTSGNFCTQCEAMGFRRITWFLDRPDVMARYSTTITADRQSCPVMLSNGNRVDEAVLPDGRHRVRWEDPYPKPSYLFALVAGNLLCHRGSFTTQSGRVVALEIWVEPQNIDRCEHALQSLQRAMRWDERVYGLEYDLDVYMIVAVNDFNMGAMENKGLNVFNSKFVLARPETATDEDYEAIERVIGHEYFHNWTGNRVTCRDWFQLTLKEGLTVFRDQQFGADMTSAAVVRIDDVKLLRTGQFAEDAGPMAHPIRPESYISMDNFYTSTVYNKGAEVIRMYDTLLGADGFRRGMDLYFERHDGEAVTCDDFRSAMADANGRDLEQFGRWYAQAGTPLIEGDDAFDPAAGRYTLTLRQSYPATGYEVVDGADHRPLHVPVVIGLLGRDGHELPLRLEGETRPAKATSRVLELTEPEQRFEFVGLSERPVPSLLRGFSAPVRLRMQRSAEDLGFLMAHDTDPFNRWDAGQELATRLLLTSAAQIGAGSPPPALDPLYSAAFGRVLADDRLDGSLRALALTLPAEKVLGQEMEVVEPDALFAAREQMRSALAIEHADALLALYRTAADGRTYANSKADIDLRRLKNCALAYLVAGGGEEAISLAIAQFHSADNMSDAQAALGVLVDTHSDEAREALEAFYERWHSDPLVLDKWFAIQATSRREDAVERVIELSGHPDFSLRNPNRVRSLVAMFCSGNQVRFNRIDGAGYRFLADVVKQLDPRNPQLAARMASMFNAWRRFDPRRQTLMRNELEGIRALSGLSKDVYEIVTRALAE
jgi:aminopeptidase N